MITVAEAKALISGRCKPLNSERIPLQRALGRVLSEPVIAPISLPGFRQSAMDGYAVIASDLDRVDVELQLVGEVAAGAQEELPLRHGEAIRIFTGAVVPDDATAVIMQEHTSVTNGGVIIHEENIPDQQNIRQVGDQIHAGEQALDKGLELNAAALGFLTSLGITEVAVFRQPKIALFTTGSELVQPGEPLGRAQIYDSNTITMESVLRKDGFEVVDHFGAEDDYQATRDALERMIREYDVLICSGGISVGDYDFVGKALNELDTEEVFYKIRQKPGKPMYYGINGPCHVFALPGNPASLLVCYYEYVRQSLLGMSGSARELKSRQMVLSASVSKKEGRALYLKAHADGDQVSPLGGQGSFILKSFAEANALIYLPEEGGGHDAGEFAEVHLLP